MIISIKNTNAKGKKKNDNFKKEIGIVKEFIFDKISLKPITLEPSIRANLFEELLKASNIIIKKVKIYKTIILSLNQLLIFKKIFLFKITNKIFSILQ